MDFRLTIIHVMVLNLFYLFAENQDILMHSPNENRVKEDKAASFFTKVLAITGTAHQCMGS